MTSLYDLLENQKVCGVFVDEKLNGIQAKQSTNDGNCQCDCMSEDCHGACDCNCDCNCQD